MKKKMTSAQLVVNMLLHAGIDLTAKEDITPADLFKILDKKSQQI